MGKSIIILHSPKDYHLNWTKNAKYYLKITKFNNASSPYIHNSTSQGVAKFVE